MTNGNALSTTERRRLDLLERRIREGLDTFLDVGIALAEIQRDRLYRVGYTSFEAYCREKFGFNRAHAYRLVAAGDVAVDVSPIGDIANEAQARELVPLDADERREVYAQATADGTEETTAAELRELAALAMEGLDAEERQAVLNGEDGRRADRAKPVDRATALASARRSLERAHRLLAPILGSADPLVRSLGRFLRRVPES